MNDNGIVFNQNARNIAFDDEHHEMMMSRYQYFVLNSENYTKYYSDLELEKQRAFNIRIKALNKLDKLLFDFDTNFTKKGGKILWANDADDARQMIYNIISQEKVKRVLKSKSSTLEEIELASYLENKKIKVVDTNIGNFICDLYKEEPYSIHSSASHKTTSQIAEIYTQKFGIKENCNAKQLTNCTRQLLKQDFYNPEAIVTGANFLISNTGTVVITENEGNILKSSTFAPIHIIVAGIDKMITSVDELSVLLPMSSIYEPNKNLSSFYTLINKAIEEGDVSQKLYLVLLNNNRTEILKKEKQKAILSCIQCGACSDVCPVFNTIGGHIYENHIPGPVGSIILPITKGMEEYSHFCSLCTSCGRCNDVCPVDIPIRDLFLENRKDLVKDDKSLIGERNFLSHLVKKMSSRKNMDKHGSGFKDIELGYFVKKKWGNKRELPKFAKESFSQYWKNINKLNQ
ncbi:MAG: lactate utilization protein [Bacteroidales bacterium]|nr:lactate utilization protein [Bacteroidales bacterium]